MPAYHFSWCKGVVLNFVGQIIPEIKNVQSIQNLIYERSIFN